MKKSVKAVNVPRNTMNKDFGRTPANRAPPPGKVVVVKATPEQASVLRGEPRKLQRDLRNEGGEE